MKNWLGREGKQLLVDIKDAEQEMCENVKGLYDVLSEKCKPQHNETLSPYCC